MILENSGTVSSKYVPLSGSIDELCLPRVLEFYVKETRCSCRAPALDI